MSAKTRQAKAAATPITDSTQNQSAVGFETSPAATAKDQATLNSDSPTDTSVVPTGDGQETVQTVPSESSGDRTGRGTIVHPTITRNIETVIAQIKAKLRHNGTTKQWFVDCQQGQNSNLVQVKRILKAVDKIGRLQPNERGHVYPEIIDEVLGITTLDSGDVDWSNPIASLKDQFPDLFKMTELQCDQQWTRTCALEIQHNHKHYYLKALRSELQAFSDHRRALMDEEHAIPTYLITIEDMFKMTVKAIGVNHSQLAVIIKSLETPIIKMAYEVLNSVTGTTAPSRSNIPSEHESALWDAVVLHLEEYDDFKHYEHAESDPVMSFTTPALATVNAMDHDKSPKRARSMDEMAPSERASSRARRDSDPEASVPDLAVTRIAKFFQEMKKDFPLAYRFESGKSPANILVVIAKQAFRDLRRNPDEKKPARSRGQGSYRGGRSRGKHKSRNPGRK